MLSDEQTERIRACIDCHVPEEVGIPHALWTRRAVRDLIRREFGIAMPVRTVGDYLKRWGYTAKVPRRHARQQDPEAVRRWLEETYPDPPLLPGNALEWSRIRAFAFAIACDIHPVQNLIVLTRLSVLALARTQ